MGRNSFVTEIVRLHAIDAQSAVDTIRPLVSTQGSVTANRGGNSLVIVDFADNIRRIRDVIGPDRQRPVGDARGSRCRMPVRGKSRPRCRR